MAQNEYRRQIGQMFGENVSSPWESLRGGLVLGGEGLWHKVRRLVADSDGDEEIRWHRRVSAEKASRPIHWLVEQETDRRVAIWLRVRLSGERMTEVAEDYGYRDGSGVHRVLQRLEEKARHVRSLSRHLKKLAEQVSSVESCPRSQLTSATQRGLAPYFGRSHPDNIRHLTRRIDAH